MGDSGGRQLPLEQSLLIPRTLTQGILRQPYLLMEHQGLKERKRRLSGRKQASVWESGVRSSPRSTFLAGGTIYSFTPVHDLGSLFQNERVRQEILSMMDHQYQKEEARGARSRTRRKG